MKIRQVPPFIYHAYSKIWEIAIEQVVFGLFFGDFWDQELLFQRIESDGGPFLKVVLECWKRCSEPFLIYIYGIQCDFIPKSCWKHSNFENRYIRYVNLAPDLRNHQKKAQTVHLLPYMWASFHPLDPSRYLSSFSSWRPKTKKFPFSWNSIAAHDFFAGLLRTQFWCHLPSQ